MVTVVPFGHYTVNGNTLVRTAVNNNPLLTSLGEGSPLVPFGSYENVFNATFGDKSAYTDYDIAGALFNWNLKAATSQVPSIDPSYLVGRTGVVDSSGKLR